MANLDGLYFVIATPGRARFNRAGPDGFPHTIVTVDHASLLKCAGGRFPAGASFASLLAARISDDGAADLFLNLVIVAPRPLLTVLAAQLDLSGDVRLAGTLAKDLIDVPDLELWPHLRPWIEPDSGG